MNWQRDGVGTRPVDRHGVGVVACHCSAAQHSRTQCAVGSLLSTKRRRRRPTTMSATASMLRVPACAAAGDNARGAGGAKVLCVFVQSGRDRFEAYWFSFFIGPGRPSSPVQLAVQARRGGREARRACRPTIYRPGATQSKKRSLGAGRRPRARTVWGHAPADGSLTTLGVEDNVGRHRVDQLPTVVSVCSTLEYAYTRRIMESDVNRTAPIGGY